MRLERIASAVAITVILVASFPQAVAESAPQATILSPSQGSVIGANSMVQIRYSGYSAPPTSPLSGYVMLDGVSAGTFFRSIEPGGVTTVQVTLHAQNFSSGDHALSARVFTSFDAPVDAPSIWVRLDHAPVVRATPTYDLDARALRVLVNVSDDSGAPVRVELSEGTLASTNATFLGEREMVLPVAHGEGTYNALLRATDSRGQSRDVPLTYTVADREASIALIEATYLVGGTLRVRASMIDPDGAQAKLSVATPFGSGNMSGVNGTWSADLMIDPRLGDHEGVLRSTDPYGGTTSLVFRFTIGGERVTLFERVVNTTVGAHSDHLIVDLGRVHAGTIEICADACADKTRPVNETATAACMAPSLVTVCDPLRGQYGTGNLRGCSGAPSPLTVQSVVHGTFALADNASGGAVCRGGLFAVENATGDPEHPSMFLHAAIVDGGNVDANACSATGDATCAFETSIASGWRLALAWEQGPQTTVTVRVSGIRV